MRSARILLAVDGAASSAAAIRWVASRYTTSRYTTGRPDPAATPIDIVSVAADDDAMDDARTAVEAARVEILRSAPGAELMTSVAGGDAFEVLVERSASTDLLVVGAGRPEPLGAFLHAGLPMRLTGRVHCRMVVVPVDWSGAPGATVAVGWDDDAAARAAVDAAAEEAEAAGLPLHIHHVWRPVPVARYDPEGGAALTAAVEQDERVALDRVVRETSARHPLLAVTGELHLGSDGAVILRHASQAALVVVGSHRRSTLGEIVFGATSDALIAQNTRVPMLITPPPSADAARSRGGR